MQSRLSLYGSVFTAFVLCFIVMTCALGQGVPTTRKEWPATSTEKLVIQTLNQRAEVLAREQANLQRDVQAVITDARSRLALTTADPPIDFDAVKGVFFVAPVPDAPAPVSSRPSPEKPGVASEKKSP